MNKSIKIFTADGHMTMLKDPNDLVVSWAFLLEYANRPDMDERDRLRMNSEIKRLTLPTEMGEQFKVMACSKQYDKVVPSWYRRYMS